MGNPRTDSGFSDFDNDYQVIRISLNWGALSISALAVTLTVNVAGDNLGASFGQLVAATMGLSVIGLAFGLIGMKFGRHRGAARVGAFLNGVVVAIFLAIAALLPVMFQILRRLG